MQQMSMSGKVVRGALIVIAAVCGFLLGDETFRGLVAPWVLGATSPVLKDGYEHVVQNLIHAGSIATQLESGTADFLLGREQVAAEPAVRGLRYESEVQADGTRRYRIVEGEATWAGQSLETCEQQLNDWGRAAFEREAQHQILQAEDGLWDRARDIDANRVDPGAVPALERIVIGVDPSGGTAQWGIIVAGRATVRGVRHSYTLEDCSTPEGSSTGVCARAVIAAAQRWKADAVAVEVNFGGDMVRYALKQTAGGEALKIIEVRASRGKLVRAEPIQGIAEEGRDHHAGVFVALEDEKCRYRAGDKSPNRMDAEVWAKTELMLRPVSTAVIPRSRSARRM